VCTDIDRFVIRIYGNEREISVTSRPILTEESEIGVRSSVCIVNVDHCWKNLYLFLT
jgi:hypothetical protein